MTDGCTMPVAEQIVIKVNEGARELAIPSKKQSLSLQSGFVLLAGICSHPLVYLEALLCWLIKAELKA